MINTSIEKRWFIIRLNYELTVVTRLTDPLTTVNGSQSTVSGSTEVKPITIVGSFSSD